MNRAQVIKFLVIQEISLIVISIIWLYFRPNINPWIKWKISLLDFSLGIGATIVMILLSFLIFSFSDHLKKTMIFLDSILFSKIKYKDILYLSILSGIGEELFFRGVLQNEFNIIISSLIFGILHLAGKNMWGYALWALFAGFYLGNIYAYTGNLFLPILIHTLNNCIAMFLWLRFKHKFIS